MAALLLVGPKVGGDLVRTARDARKPPSHSLGVRQPGNTTTAFCLFSIAVMVVVLAVLNTHQAITNVLNTCLFVVPRTFCLT
jgi:hypothetical protein